MSAPELILPISDLQINTLVKWAKEPDLDDVAEKIEQWAAHSPIEQVISALIIQQVPQLVAKRRVVPVSLEKVLAQLIEATKELDQEEAFRSGIPAQIDLAKLKEGAFLMAAHDVDVLRHSEIEPETPEDVTGMVKAMTQGQPETPNYFDQDGNWDTQFTRRQHEARDPFTREVPLPGSRSVRMTDPQARFFNKFLSEPDESSALMSYFGGGKTFMAREMLGVIEQYKEFKPAVLAMTKAQLQGLLKRLDAPETRALTFGQLAGQILGNQQLPSHWRPGNRRDPSYFLSAGETAKRLQFRNVAKLSPATVADIAMKAVRRFCRSGQDRILEWHLPYIKDRISAADKAALVNYAQELWDETVEPNDPNSQLPVRAYHLIKYCALRGFTAPETYTHFLIDEAHDLSKPMLQILDAGPQTVQTMGDPYQRLSGKMPSRSQAVRPAEIGFTVRASNQVEGMFNTLIEKHPVSTSVALQGSRHTRTRIAYYDPERPRIPQGKATILVSDLFELTEWFHRLREAGTAFSILPGSAHNFFEFNESLVGLYFNGTRATSHVLFRYPDWEALRQDKGNSGAFQRMEAMLSGGSGRQHDFSQAMDVLTTPEKANIILGLAQDARNTEFDRVMLAPDLLIDTRNIKAASQQSEVLSTIYVGASRARFELILPGHLQNWLEIQKTHDPSVDNGFE